MRKFLVLCLLLLSMTLMASIKTYEFEGLFYPITFLRASDKAMESAECVDIIDENTIEVKFEGKETTDLVTFLSISDVENEDFKSGMIQKNTEHLLDQTMYLSYDWKGSNEAGEILSYVWLPHKTPIGEFKLLWNEVLLLSGYAQMNDDVIQTERAILFAESYKHARDNKIGLWKNIDTEKPLDFSELPKNIQEYLIEKYISGFDTEDTITMALGLKTLYQFDNPAYFGNKIRIGAICNDGTRSGATGPGACSHHGGVKRWLYADE